MQDTTETNEQEPRKLSRDLDAIEAITSINGNLTNLEKIGMIEDYSSWREAGYSVKESLCQTLLEQIESWPMGPFSD
jgi:hypothetical protein